MEWRINIFGASGSGTTTLARSLAEELSCPHFDYDYYYWLPTDPPFQTARERLERQELLRRDLTANPSWTLSGPICTWGEFALEYVHLVVFLYVSREARMQRLLKREVERYGPDILSPEHPDYKRHNEFLRWAEAYDTGDLDMRSLAQHEAWMSALTCPLLRLETDRPESANVETVLQRLDEMG